MKKPSRRTISFIVAALSVGLTVALISGALESTRIRTTALSSAHLLAQSLLATADEGRLPQHIEVHRPDQTVSAWVGTASQLSTAIPDLANQAELDSAIRDGSAENAWQLDGPHALAVTVILRSDIPATPVATNPVLSRVVITANRYSFLVGTTFLIAFLGCLVLAGLAYLVLNRQSLAFTAILNQLLGRIPESSQNPPNQATGHTNIANLVAAIESRFATHTTLQSDKLNRALNQLNSLLLMLNSMNEGVIVTDMRGRIRLMNPCARSFFGLEDIPDSQLLQAPLLERVHASDLFALFEAIVANHNPAEMELTLYRQPICTLHVSASWIPSQDLAEQGVLFVLTDISTLKHLESVRTEFVANVSHELRTPITALKGFAETLLDGALDEPDTARQFVGIIQRQAERLMAIIEDLLMLSRLEQSGGAIPRETCSLKELVEAALEVSRPHAKTKNSRIIYYFEEMTISANRHLLEQAIINLVENAIKYSPDGTEIQIGATHIASPKAWEISVSDNGPGIPLRDQARLFERFYRIDKARSRTLGGTGLGLAIVRHIALVHGGSVRLESTSGLGSRFIIHIPDFG